MSALKSKILSAKDPHFSKKTEPSEEKSTHLSEEHSQSSKNSHQMKELLELFRQFVTHTKNVSDSGVRSRGNAAGEMEPRDREVEIALPVERGNQLRLQSLEHFVTGLCRAVWSRGFHYYSTDQLSLEHTKTYCSQQILRNLARLAGKYSLSGEHFASINAHTQKLLGYMLSKYPMTLSQDINRSVNGAIRQIDNTDQLSNDYVYTSPVVFRFRESADYSDLIMRMVNDLLRKLDLKIGGRTVYEKFDDKMDRLFENVMDLRWMQDVEEERERERMENNGIRKRAQSREQIQLQKQLQKMKLEQIEKYRSKVQQYTSYKIGRKVPQSTRPFTQEEISSRNIRIDNPQVLRLLTKWCEELQRKFTTPNYFAHYIQTLKLEDGKYVAEVPDQIKECLDQLMAEEHRSIKQEMTELTHNNHCLQGELLLRELARPGRPELESLQCIAARYSAGLVHNLHAYIIAYLNRLIHGLLTVALKFGKSRSVKANQWSSNLNLITFQVMDLLRCRCASGEKEVLRLYHQLVRMCEGESFRMVRVINRLRMGTNDILINIKYKDIICEVQLSVTSTNNNKFIQYSNTYNHYLYELRRSFFGPLTELCSIWKSLDPRFTYYDRSCPALPSPVGKNNHPCRSQRQFQSFYRPFICSACGQHHFHNNYIRHHLKCRCCSYWLCAKCQIDAMDSKALLAAAFKNEEIIRNCLKVSAPSHPIPQFGVCVFIESQQLKVQPFRRHTDKDRTRLIGVKNRKLYEIADISSNQGESRFRKSFLIFEVGQAFGRRHIKIEDERVREFCIEETLREVFQKNKERICLNYASLTNEHLAHLSLLGSLQQKANIKKVEVIGNKLNSAATIAQQFKNLRYLEISKNKVEDFTGIQKLEKLQKLFVIENNLKEVPLAVVGLWSLKELSLAWNQIKSLPQQLAKLHKLKILKVGNNKIETFNNCISQLFYLTDLSMKNNLLTSIPQGIKALNELTSLQLQNNLIKEIHPNFGALSCLQRLNLSSNQISNLPDAFTGMNSLIHLNLCHNRLQTLPASISTLSFLERLDLSNNQLTSLPSLSRLHHLSDLNLNYNMLGQLPQLPSEGCCLRVLSLSHNGLRYVPSIATLPHLEELYLNNNSIESVHDSLAKMERLEVLKLEHNSLAKVPELRIENLKTLNISQNKLTSFANMDLICLEQLDLSGNFIEVFTSNLLPSLKRINLANNKLEAVEIANFLKLRYVHLSYNKLKAFPKFSQRNHIKVLSLQHNLIDIIPSTISELLSLNMLNLSHNSITVLPRELQYIEGLKQRGLDLSHNSIQKVECWDFLMRKGTKNTIQSLEKSLPVGDAPPSLIKNTCSCSEPAIRELS